MMRIESRRRAEEGGYIALLAVLIAGAAALAIAVTLLATGTDAQRSTLVGQQSMQARQAAVACAEEALQAIKDATAFTGTNTLTINTSSCSFTVTNTGATTRTLVATGTAGSVVRKLTIYATIGASSISITSWQESS